MPKGRESSKMTDDDHSDHNIVKMMRFWYKEFHAREDRSKAFEEFCS